MVAKDLLSDVNSACQDLHAGGLTWAKTSVILYLRAKIGQRNQESIRNHLGNSETIDSWLKVLPTYWLWDQRQGSENRRNYPFLAVLGIRKPVWTVSLTSSLSSRRANFFEGPFYICPYNSILTVSIGVLIGDLALKFRFLRPLAHLARNYITHCSLGEGTAGPQ